MRRARFRSPDVTRPRQAEKPARQMEWPVESGPDDTQPRRSPVQQRDDDRDLTAVRADIGVYDPTIPRAMANPDSTDDTVAAPLPGAMQEPGITEEKPVQQHVSELPDSMEAASSAPTWFVSEDDALRGESRPVASRHPASRPPVAAPVEEEPLPEPRRRSRRRRGPSRKRRSARSPAARSLTDLTTGRHDLTASLDATTTRNRSTWLRDIAVVVVGAMFLTTLVRSFLLQPFAVPSPSMQDTLQISDKIVVSKAMGYKRGDVVVFRDELGWLPGEGEKPGPVMAVLEGIGVVPNSGEQHLVKRVIGLPGDVVSCCAPGGHLSINGAPVDERGIIHAPAPGRPPRAAYVPFRVTVPEGKVFVLGDNRDDSADSRCHLSPNPDAGFIDEDADLGPVNMIVAPVNRWEYLSAPDVYGAVPDAPGPAPAQPRVETEGGC